jgi:hypothetical protein
MTDALKTCMQLADSWLWLYVFIIPGCGVRYLQVFEASSHITYGV